MHHDLAEEQVYFDLALAQRERHRDQLMRAPEAAAHPKMAVQLRERLEGLALAGPDESVAFGRTDAEGERLYIGKNAIWDDDGDLMVINWQVNAAGPFTWLLRRIRWGLTLGEPT